MLGGGVLDGPPPLLELPVLLGVGRPAGLEGARAGSLEASPSPSTAPTTVTLGQDLPPGTLGDLCLSSGGWGVQEGSAILSWSPAPTFGALSPEDSHLKRQGGSLCGMLTIRCEPFAPAPGCDSPGV